MYFSPMLSKSRLAARWMDYQWTRLISAKLCVQNRHLSRGGLDFSKDAISEDAIIKQLERQFQGSGVKVQ